MKLKKQIEKILNRNLTLLNSSGSKVTLGIYQVNWSLKTAMRVKDIFIKYLVN